jgi:hypothetical protein
MTFASDAIHYTCEEECEFYCSGCARVEWYNEAIKQEQGNHYYQFSQRTDDKWALTDMKPSDPKVMLGWNDGEYVKTVLIEKLQHKEESLVMLCELEVPEPGESFSMSHTRDAMFWQTSNNRLVVVYLKDLSYRLFNLPDGFPNQKDRDDDGIYEWVNRSVSLVYDNRVISYQSRTSDRVEDFSIVLFDLHKQVVFHKFANTFAILFDSPPVQAESLATQSSHPAGLLLKSNDQETDVKKEIHKHVVCVTAKFEGDDWGTWMFDLFDNPSLQALEDKKAFHQFIFESYYEWWYYISLYSNANTSQIGLLVYDRYWWCSFTSNEDRTGKREGEGEDAYIVRSSHLSKSIYGQ